MRSLLPRAPSVADAGIAALAGIVVTVGTVGAGMAQEWARTPDAGAVACALLAAAALAWRRAEPLFALGSAVVVVSTYLAAGYAWGPILLCIVVGVFETARLRSWTTSLPACGVAVTIIAVANLLRGAHYGATPAVLLIAWGGWLIIPWSLGALAHVRGAAAERQRRELAARAKLEERMRVAREVHDIAGHGFATAAMQAGVALLVFDEQPEQAKRSLESIRTTSTKALTELRTMLDAFYPEPDGASSPTDRAHGDAGAAERTSPSRGDPSRELEELVATVRAGGLTVELDVEGVDTTLPQDIASALYRVVQESLTNVMRHAEVASASVRVYREGTDLVSEIADRGAGTGDADPAAGRGLTGMRERVEATGGTVSAGARPDGGFLVVARLPVSERRA